jgi:hypothetical protein
MARTDEPGLLLLCWAAVPDTPVEVHVAHGEGRVLAGGNFLVVEDHPAPTLQRSRQAMRHHSFTAQQSRNQQQSLQRSVNFDEDETQHSSETDCSSHHTAQHT